MSAHVAADLLGNLIAVIAARSRAGRGDLCATRRTYWVADGRICMNSGYRGSSGLVRLPGLG
jgi:hypothetical protein